MSPRQERPETPAAVAARHDRPQPLALGRHRLGVYRKESTDAKRQIGAATAPLLRPGEVVVLDGGTTPLAVAKHLPADLAVTVVTHSLPALEVLSEHPKAECVVVGGRLFKAARASPWGAPPWMRTACSVPTHASSAPRRSTPWPA